MQATQCATPDENDNPSSRLHIQISRSNPHATRNRNDSKDAFPDTQISADTVNPSLVYGRAFSNDSSTTSRTKQAQGQDAADILAAYRRRAERAERRKPGIPQRTTSTLKPAKRKRHEDMVSFHRNSCQLFSSLDGALAQMGLPSASSSSCSSSPSPSSSPVLGSCTRETSLDYPSPRPSISSTIADGKSSSFPSTRPMSKRPPLQRMSCTVTPTQSRDQTSVIAQQRDMIGSKLTSQQSSNSSPSLSSPSEPLARPPTITTHSCYSSQTTLPLQSHTDPKIGISHNPTSTTTIHWTSPESRRREHAKIDAANSGLRLFLRRIFPRPLCRRVGGGRAAFWDERDGDTIKDDSTSVRRFRISVEDNIETQCEESQAELMEREKQELDGLDDKSVLVKAEEVSPQRNWDEKARINDQSRTNTQSSLVSGVSFSPILRQRVQRKSAWRRMLSCAAK